MKYASYLAVLATLMLTFPLALSARNKNQHSVDIPEAVQVGTSQLKPGSYKVEWQGTGPHVQVTFLQNGNTVATVPGTLKTNDNQAIQDAVVTTTTGSANTKVLEEIDFGHQKEALVFRHLQSGT
jgi:hypothetical protein